MSSILFVDLRVVRASIVANVGSHFTSPPSGMGWANPWNVYNLTQMATEGFVTVPPFVFVIAAHPEPTPSRIPMVVVDPTFIFSTNQLGSRAGCAINIQLHCWGQSRAVRDDIATMLANVYAGKTEKPTSISIWTSLSDTTEASVAEIRGDVAIEFPTAGGALSAEGTLRNWTIVSFSLRVK